MSGAPPSPDGLDLAARFGVVNCHRLLSRFGAGFRSSTAVRVGLRTDGARNTCANGSAEELVVVGFYGYLRNPLYVAPSSDGSGCGCLRTVELAFNRIGVGRGAWHSYVRAVV